MGCLGDAVTLTQNFPVMRCSSPKLGSSVHIVQIHESKCEANFDWLISVAARAVDQVVERSLQ